MSNDYSIGIEESSSWVDPVLASVFLIHTFAFIYLYIKRRHFYTAMLILAFPLLFSYYTMRSFHVYFDGMDWLRWSGIGLATISVIFAIKDFISKRLSRRNQKPPSVSIN